MTKETLLWLLLHGAAVWQAGLAICVIAGLVGAALRARRAGARGMAAARACLGEPASAELKEGETVTLAGRIEASGELPRAGAAALDVSYPAVVRGSETIREGLAQ